MSLLSFFFQTDDMQSVTYNYDLFIIIQEKTFNKKKVLMLIIKPSKVFIWKRLILLNRIGLKIKVRKK